MIKERIEKGLEYWEIPEHMWSGIVYYIMHGTRPGGFLEAVFSDSLVEAAGRADEFNIQVLKNYAGFLYNVAPSECWGSREIVDKWKGLSNENNE